MAGSEAPVGVHAPVVAVVWVVGAARRAAAAAAAGPKILRGPAAAAPALVVAPSAHGVVVRGTVRGSEVGDRQRAEHRHGVALQLCRSLQLKVPINGKQIPKRRRFVFENRLMSSMLFSEQGKRW